MIRKPFEGEHFQSQFFWSWKQWSVQKEQILTNVTMFIPVGVLAGRLQKWKGLLAAAGFSIVIEFLQRVTARGLMEFDDVLHNCFGAAIGIGIVMVGRKLVGESE